MEVWGAQGGAGKTNGKRGGYGGYSTGKVILSPDKEIYINIGGQGVTSTSITGGTSLGGYNGGGSGYNTGSWGKYGSGGGGATHIATISGELEKISLDTDLDKILIVAGGGGAGFNHSDSTYDAIGGDGGGFQGNGNLPGTQTGGGGGFGYGYDNTNNGSGGGGGYYGGGRGGDSTSSGGGSGYIGNTLLKDKYMYCYNCTTSDDKNTKTYTTTNVSEIPITNYAKSGSGAARITSFNYVTGVNYGQNYGTLPTPTREGYTFLGWFTEQDGGTQITSDTIFNGNSNQTLYAHWQAN